MRTRARGKDAKAGKSLREEREKVHEDVERDDGGDRVGGQEQEEGIRRRRRRRRRRKRRGRGKERREDPSDAQDRSPRDRHCRSEREEELGGEAAGEREALPLPPPPMIPLFSSSSALFAPRHRPAPSAAEGERRGTRVRIQRDGDGRVAGPAVDLLLLLLLLVLRRKRRKRRRWRERRCCGSYSASTSRRRRHRGN